MVMRLSELLDRIRPAGAPGAASEGEYQRARDALDEIAGIAELLRSFEAEADAVITAGHDEAEQLRRRAERRVHEIHAELPDRLAMAGTGSARQAEVEGDARLEGIADETDRVIRELRSRAAGRMPRLVDAALEVVWQSLPTAAVSNEGPR
jgi:hypothetical protein